MCRYNLRTFHWRDGLLKYAGYQFLGMWLWMWGAAPCANFEAVCSEICPSLHCSLVPEKVSFAETKQEIRDKSNGDIKLPSDGKTAFPAPPCLQWAPDTYMTIKTNQRAQVCVYASTTTWDLQSPVVSRARWMDDLDTQNSCSRVKVPCFSKHNVFKRE